MTTLQTSSGKNWIAPIVVFLVLSGAAAAVLLPHFLRGGPEPPPFEIAQFVGKPEIYSREQGRWVPISDKRMLGPKDKIRTDAGSEVTLRIPDAAEVRLKPNSELEGKNPGLLEKGEKGLVYRLQLMKGVLQVSADKDLKKKGRLEVSTPALVAAVRGTLFQVSVDPKTRKSSVNVLRGEVEVHPRPVFIAKPGPSVIVHSFEKVEAEAGSQAVLKPVPISREDWDQVKALYELTQRSAEFEARQLDLSKQAGGLFEYVFDHGTFFTPEFGHAEREFMKDDATGDVILTVSYDVFPRGSLVGVYMKTRNFDFSKFDALEFEVAKVPEQASPDSLRFEVKSKGQILRAMKVENLENTWKKVRVPFKFAKSIPITEVTLVFTHETIGELKTGSVQFRRFNMVPLSGPPPTAAAPDSKTAAPPPPAKKSSKKTIPLSEL